MRNASAAAPARAPRVWYGRRGAQDADRDLLAAAQFRRGMVR
jgi:hypothetical protein